MRRHPCARSRYDARQGQRFKAVKLLVSQRASDPAGVTPPTTGSSRCASPFADLTVRDQVKQAGRTRNPERRVWSLRHDRVVALDLASRIVDDPAFYEVAGADSGVVRVLAVGRKRRNVLTIGGKEIRL